MPLTARQVETAKPGRYTDGRGLMLLVKTSGARSWVLRYQINGRRRDLGLGSWPETTLAMAREQAGEARKLLASGRDPLVEKQSVKHLSVREAAETLIAAKRSGWRNPKHAAQWGSTLAAYVYPLIGDRDVRDIGTHDVLRVLKPIWVIKTETASRVRQRIEAVLDYAAALSARDGANPARWRGHMDHLLPKPSMVRMVEHHPALDWRDAPAFMTALEGRTGAGARALAFLILTAARSGEVRGASWAEIDLEARVWTVPAVRMKALKEHRVPLSDAAIVQLGQRGEDGDLLFPGSRGLGRPMSDMTLTALLKRMKMGEITAHGFRSTFRDWAGETTPFPREVIEAALAHRLKDKAEAAYARGDLFDKRRALMDAWATYLSSGDAASGR
ncbi:MAG: tyrosine-type recombinase/integrase [Hyphomicrobiaceae bacterium]